VCRGEIVRPEAAISEKKKKDVARRFHLGVWALERRKKRPSHSYQSIPEQTRKERSGLQGNWGGGKKKWNCFTSKKKAPVYFAQRYSSTEHAQTRPGNKKDGRRKKKGGEGKKEGGPSCHSYGKRKSVEHARRSAIRKGKGGNFPRLSGDPGGKERLRGRKNRYKERKGTFLGFRNGWG